MLSVACDVASALLHLHSHNIVHGDGEAEDCWVGAVGRGQGLGLLDRSQWVACLLGGC